MFWIFKKEKAVVKEYLKSHISVKTKHGTYGWSHTINNKDEYVLPWREFLKWYHSRPQSQVFNFYYDCGFRSFKRKDIQSIHVYHQSIEI